MLVFRVAIISFLIKFRINFVYKREKHVLIVKIGVQDVNEEACVSE